MHDQQRIEHYRTADLTNGERKREALWRIEWEAELRRPIGSLERIPDAPRKAPALVRTSPVYSGKAGDPHGTACSSNRGAVRRPKLGRSIGKPLRGTAATALHTVLLSGVYRPCVS